MISKIFHIAFIAAIIFSGKAVAQDFCGTDFYTAKLFAEHPELAQQSPPKIPNGIYTQSSAIKIIPVVVHILHQYGVENISNAQVNDAIRILNEDYQAANPDLSQVIPYYQPLIGNCNVEFRLATKDPNGNCATGIERLYTNLTNQADDNSKISQWPRNKYLNIWVVKTIGSTGVAGYAYIPSSVANPPFANYDGIMILHDYFGSIGTGSPGTSRALTHEVGHWLNLYHLSSPNCVDGDGVSDTPAISFLSLICAPTPPNYPEWRNCDTAVIENVENYMQYTYCSRMFTAGQCLRMDSTLNSGIAQRNNLWTTANNLSTGTDSVSYANIPTCAPVADFYANRYHICQGGTVTFSNASWGGIATNYNWNFSSGTPATSTATNPTVTFNTWGWQQVSLIASNSSGSDTTTRSAYIFVSPPWWDYWGTFSEGMETNTFQSQWIVEDNMPYPSSFVVTSSAAFSGSKCVMLNAINNSYSMKDAIISPSVNLSTCSNVSINFKYSCATQGINPAQITENVRVYVSTNCGQTWTQRGYISPTVLTNAGNWPVFFVPSSSQWASASFSIPISYMQSNVRFKIQYESGNYSNAIYIDDINLSGTVGEEEIFYNTASVTISPNPSSGIFTVTSQEEITAIEVYNLLGEAIYKTEKRDVKQEIDLSAQAKGIYFVKIVSGDKTASQKIVVE